MRKTALVSMSSFIADRREAIASQRKALAAIQAHSADFAPAYAILNKLAKCAALDGDINVGAEPEVWEHWDGNKTLTLRAYLTLRNVQSLKEGRVPMALAAAMTNGFAFDETKDYASEYYAERTYRGESRVGNVVIKLSIIADVASDAQACKRVQVGTELKSVPKFEIVCV